MTELTRADKDVLLAYTRDIQIEMGLADWQVRLVFDDHPVNESALAEVRMNVQRKSAWIRFSESFRDQSPEEIRQAVVHELSHLHLEQPWRLLAGAARRFMSADAWGVLETESDIQMEQAVDMFARVIAPRFMPLIWPGDLKEPGQADNSADPDTTSRDDQPEIVTTSHQGGESPASA